MPQPEEGKIFTIDAEDVINNRINIDRVIQYVKQGNAKLSVKNCDLFLQNDSTFELSGILLRKASDACVGILHDFSPGKKRKDSE